MAKPSSSRTALSSRSGAVQTETKTPYDVLSEYKALRYDYGLVSEQHRRVVQDAAVDIRRRQRRAVEDMLAIGRRLIEVKDYLLHGKFEGWIEAEFDITARLAQNMMSAARLYMDEAKAKRVSLLSDGAVYLLTAPSTPDSAREQVERIIEQTGKAPTRAEVQRIIEEAKAKRVSLLRDEIKGEMRGSVERAPAHRMIEMQAETPAADLRQAADLVVTDSQIVWPNPPSPPEPEPDAINADYTVMEPAQAKPQSLTVGAWVTPFLPAPDDGKVYIPLSRELAQKLCDGVVHRIFRTFFSGDEMDQLLIALTRALEGEA